MDIPKGLYYTREHFWVKREDSLARCGITDFAQQELGDVIFVELPQVGEKVERGDRLGDVESIKTVSNLYAPLKGEIVEVNKELDSTPEVINKDPYGKGWICLIQPDTGEDFNGLLNEEDYRVHVKEED